MELLQLKSNLGTIHRDRLPLTVYTVGTEIQPPITRMKGFSAHQLFLTASGTGKFRRLDHDKDKWDILREGHLLYIPAGCAHEYMATGDEPWQVAYVTFIENVGGAIACWGFRDSPRMFDIQDTAAFIERIHEIWTYSGGEYDPWRTTESLLSLLVAVMKSTQAARPAVAAAATPSSYREPGVEAAVQFIRDHLNRPITIAQLAEHVGYSQKQLTRLFRKELGTTPLQYLHKLRLHAADMLLHDYPYRAAGRRLCRYGAGLFHADLQAGFRPPAFRHLAPLTRMALAWRRRG